MTAIANLPDLRPSLLLDFANSGRVDPRIQCTRASSATCYGPDGKLRTVAANVPRIDYDPVTGKCLGLLVEEVRTNLWLNSATATAQSFAVTAQAYTLSFEGAGSIALSGVHSGNTSTGAVVGGRRVLMFTPETAGTLTCTPTGDVRNVQLEAGAFSTSYIPTQGSAATRAADDISMSAQAWYSAAVGSFEVRGRVVYGQTSPLLKVGTDGHFDFNGAAMTTTNAAVLRASFRESGGSALDLSAGALPTTGSFAFTASYTALTTVSAASNGLAATTGATTWSGSASTLWIGMGFVGGSSTLRTARANGRIASIKYYPVRLTDAQLQRLTA